MRWPRRKKKTEKKNSWPEKPAPKQEKVSSKKFKLRLPGFRTFKRVLAFGLMVFHFVVSQLAWTGPEQNQPLALIFLFTSFMLADYLWKTRRRQMESWV